MTAHIVGRLAELPLGSTKIVTVGRRSIGIVRTTDGRLYAFRNVCPHHGAPLCAGHVTGKMSVSQPHEYLYDEMQSLIRCPWHGYAFRLEDGRADLKPETLRVRTYPVNVDQGRLVVQV